MDDYDDYDDDAVDGDVKTQMAYHMSNWRCKINNKQNQSDASFHHICK